MSFRDSVQIEKTLFFWKTSQWERPFRCILHPQPPSTSLRWGRQDIRDISNSQRYEAYQTVCRIRWFSFRIVPIFQINGYKKAFQARFKSQKSTCSSLPLKPPTPLQSHIQHEVSRCIYGRSSRSFDCCHYHPGRCHRREEFSWPCLEIFCIYIGGRRRYFRYRERLEYTRAENKAKCCGPYDFRHCYRIY